MIFDPTHIIKNIHNNFLSRKVFTLPRLLPLVPDSITASFDDIVRVYNIECEKPLKIAHHLSETVLQPKSIEKVNVKLALAIFHESTITALKHFGFHETARVIEFFLKLWSVLNVSNSTIGKRK